MAVDTTIPRTRRAVLAGGISGLATLVASAVGRPIPTQAADGAPLVLGAENRSTRATLLIATVGEEAGLRVASDGDALHCQSSGRGYGVLAESVSGDGILASATIGCGVQASSAEGTGVLGHGRGEGVYGTSWYGAGVRGDGGADVEVPATPRLTGVYGFGSGPDARGVTGQTYAGRAVNGIATTGTALHGRATRGFALRAIGRIKFDKCVGVATIAAGSRTVVVSPGINLTSGSAVVATLQGSAGAPTTAVCRVVVNARTNRFTIYLTARATRSVRVAWHVFG